MERERLVSDLKAIEASVDSLWYEVHSNEKTPAELYNKCSRKYNNVLDAIYKMECDLDV